MIVDLVRNDLGRVCATGSVGVPELCAVEEHPGLVHLVSTVSGELADGAGFGPSCSPRPSRPDPSPERPRPRPCGSSRRWRPPRAAHTAGASAGSTPTGAPPSSPSASAPSGSTARPPAARACSSAPAAGITWGSDPDREWAETELKAARLLRVASGHEMTRAQGADGTMGRTAR